MSWGKKVSQIHTLRFGYQIRNTLTTEKNAEKILPKTNNIKLLSHWQLKKLLLKYPEYADNLKDSSLKYLKSIAQLNKKNNVKLQEYKNLISKSGYINKPIKNLIEKYPKYLEYAKGEGTAYLKKFTNKPAITEKKQNEIKENYYENLFKIKPIEDTLKDKLLWKLGKVKEIDYSYIKKVVEKYPEYKNYIKQESTSYLKKVKPNTDTTFVNKTDDYFNKKEQLDQLSVFNNTDIERLSKEYPNLKNYLKEGSSDFLNQLNIPKSYEKLKDNYTSFNTINEDIKIKENMSKGVGLNFKNIFKKYPEYIEYIKDGSSAYVKKFFPENNSLKNINKDTNVTLPNEIINQNQRVSSDSTIKAQRFSLKQEKESSSNGKIVF